MIALAMYLQQQLNHVQAAEIDHPVVQHYHEDSESDNEIIGSQLHQGGTEGYSYDGDDNEEEEEVDDYNFEEGSVDIHSEIEQPQLGKESLEGKEKKE